MPTERIYTQLRGLAETLEAGELLKISEKTATLSQRGRISHMGFEAIIDYLGQVPIKDLAKKLKRGQVLKLGWSLPCLTQWGRVIARGYTAIAVRLNRRG